MSLLKRLDLLPRRSLYHSILLAMIATLSLSFLVFREISYRLERRHFGQVYDRLDEFQLQASRRIFESEGTGALSKYLSGLDRLAASRHYLLKSDGTDIVSGTSRTSLLPPAPSSHWRVLNNGRSIAAQRSADGQYWFAADGPGNRLQLWPYLPYYFLVIGATGILCWLASIRIVSPIRRITTTMANFGSGDLSVRVRSDRPDEIGQLGTSFNEMAESLQRKIVSERRLLADISHELRSPLARLKFAVRLARTSTDTEVALDRIASDIDRIAGLVSDLVETVVVEGEADTQRATTICYGEVLGEVIRDCSLEAQARDCNIASNDWPSGELIGNRELLRRAVENVIRNGIRYSPKRSSVDVFATENPDGLDITVRDYGPGVPENALTRIFDPFFRVETARDALGGGSGLGLSIAKRAIQMHNGTITAENANPGLRVHIKIPIAREATQSVR
ncbi:MAG TPA: ATP-binding protein [Edaphobacter sp.]|nr:ATP-binding protein [Edaphobacter sp.]